MPKRNLLIECDEGAALNSAEWHSFLSEHNPDASVSGRWNYHDDTVVERLFQLWKRERIRMPPYFIRAAANQDVFDDIEIFYSRKRKHSENCVLSPGVHQTKQRT